MRPLGFAVLRRLDVKRWTSGSVLAVELGVTRSAINDALRDAQSCGVHLQRIQGRGYRLDHPVEFIDADLVRAHLGRSAPLLRLEVLDETESTSTLVSARAAAGEPGGLCIIAENQTAGRGRMGREWHAGLGGSLTFSVLWRFQRGASALAGLSLAVSVAVLRGMRDLGIEDARVKWPNDIVFKYQKLGGILIETQGDMLGPSAAVIGIGLNYRLDEGIKERIGQPVTDVLSICKDPPGRNLLFAAVLRNLAALLRLFDTYGFEPVRSEWMAVHAYHNREVRVVPPNADFFYGVVDGVAADGTLLIRQGNEQRRFTSAEISLRVKKA